jgi:threonine/homoserine/homoserine lactone efflux protein
VDALAAGLFLLSAFALLGSPGPGIAALVAIGRLRGFAGGLRFFLGLQLGLAAAAAVSAAGLASLVGALPGMTQLLMIAACVYLLWLAWAIATSPIGESVHCRGVNATFGAGLALGLSNPKAYLAFVTLFASQTIWLAGSRGDAALKWALTVAVIVIVDIVWLYAGARLARISLSVRGERTVNVALGLAILVVALNSLRGITM